MFLNVAALKTAKKTLCTPCTLRFFAILLCLGIRSRRFSKLLNIPSFWCVTGFCYKNFRISVSMSALSITVFCVRALLNRALIMGGILMSATLAIVARASIS